jgi:hypothetical protein
MTDLPNGPLPDVNALKPRVQAILEDLGVAITMNELCERLEDEYKIHMKSHVGALKVIIYDVTKEAPAIRVALSETAQANRKKVNRKKAKREKAKREEASKAKQKKEPKPAQSAKVIFGNERRPAIVEAIRARGGKINAARVGAEITALWHAETDRDTYFALAVKDRERYADEKAVYADGAQPPSTHDVAPPHWPSVSAAAASVYRYAVGYLQPFLVTADGMWVDSKMARHQRTRWAALCLMAAGRGPVRAPTCDHMLRVASGERTSGQELMRHALFLLRPGELQQLRLPGDVRFLSVHVGGGND